MHLDRRCDVLRFDEFGRVGDGGNSGFHALNLAMQFGADRVALVGFDMTLDEGVHWHGRHERLNNPRESNLTRWRKAFEASAPMLQAAGIAVFNTSDHSRLDCFPFARLEDVLT